MIVRVFVPKPYDPADGSDLAGHEFNFPALPSVGQTIRLTHPEPRELKVKEVGFVQDGEAFVACVWVHSDLPITLDMAALGLGIGSAES